MTSSEFAGNMQIIVPRIIERYMESQAVVWETAIEHLYGSILYQTLEDADTSLWHLSPLLLCELLIEEMKTGNITWPKEQSV